MTAVAGPRVAPVVVDPDGDAEDSELTPRGSPRQSNCPRAAGFDDAGPPHGGPPPPPRPTSATKPRRGNPVATTSVHTAVATTADDDVHRGRRAAPHTMAGTQRQPPPPISTSTSSNSFASSFHHNDATSLRPSETSIVSTSSSQTTDYYDRALVQNSAVASPSGASSQRPSFATASYVSVGPSSAEPSSSAYAQQQNSKRHSKRPSFQMFGWDSAAAGGSTSSVARIRHSQISSPIASTFVHVASGASLAGSSSSAAAVAAASELMQASSASSSWASSVTTAARPELESPAAVAVTDLGTVTAASATGATFKARSVSSLADSSSAARPLGRTSLTGHEAAATAAAAAGSTTATSSSGSGSYATRSGSAELLRMVAAGIGNAASSLARQVNRKRSGSRNRLGAFGGSPASDTAATGSGAAADSAYATSPSSAVPERPTPSPASSFFAGCSGSQQGGGALAQMVEDLQAAVERLVGEQRALAAALTDETACRERMEGELRELRSRLAAIEGVKPAN